MPFNVEIHSDQVGLIHTVFGIVSDEDLIAMDDENIRITREIGQMKFILVDYTSVEAVEVSNAVLSMLAKRDRDRFVEGQPFTLIVTVAPGDLGFGLARMFGASADTGEYYGVFRTRTEAEAWLKQRVSEVHQHDVVFD